MINEQNLRFNYFDIKGNHVAQVNDIQAWWAVKRLMLVPVPDLLPERKLSFDSFEGKPRC